MPPVFFLLLLVLASSAVTQESLEKHCLMLLCADGICHKCPGMTSHQLSIWRKYIDVLLQKFKANDEQTLLNYYKRIREQPLCVKIAPGDHCTLSRINEPKVPPYQFYELACRKLQDFWSNIKCVQSGSRCCNTTLCNLPTENEISKLTSNVPTNSTLIAVLPVVLVILLFVIIGSCCYWRCHHKLYVEKARHMPVSVIGNALLGDHQHLSVINNNPSSDTAVWIESGSAVSTSVVTPSPINGSLGGGDPALFNPTRQPLLPPNTSISSGVLLTKSTTGPLSVYRSGAMQSSGVNSIGSGIFGGSVGAYGPNTSYAPTSIVLPGNGGDTGMLPSSISAPPGTALDVVMTSSGSGSGAGQPLLVERTVARQVYLEQRIGAGREKEIYETATLRHSNILGFIAADNKDNGLSTELWLIIEYHPLGSLYEFLQLHAFSLPALVKMVSSIANGLAHLHMPIIGTSGKPRIAHRDLKSRNILVKADGECCIGDLGFAVKLDPQSGNVDVAQNTERVGTKRYMAPEVLDNTMRANSFDAYMQADMYSLGLVFWEMTRRVYVPDLYGPEEYQLPYQGSVASDPLVEEMKSVVCEQGLRPHLPIVWQKNPTLYLLFKIMTECWFAAPSDRLSAMRIKKDLGNQRQSLGRPLPFTHPPVILNHQLQSEYEGCEDTVPSSHTQLLPPGMFCCRLASDRYHGEAAIPSSDQSELPQNNTTHLAAGNIQPPNIVANFVNNC